MKIALATMGGTIAMAPNDSGSLQPALDGTAIMAAVPQLQSLPALSQITAESICALGSPSITQSHVRQAFDYANAQVDAGAGAVIVTHGTDTLEESAFLFDLWWDRPEPVIFTGAMRSSSQPGADGPANLYASVRAALDPHARSRGVLVVMNDEVFDARDVSKADTFALNAFRALDGSPIGRLIEERVHWSRPAHHRPARLPAPQRRATVALVGVGIGDNGRYLSALTDCIDGLVIDGVGAGHVSAECADVLETLNATMPVIVASRTGGGPTGTTTYGYPGAEVDLLRRGIIMSGYLTGVQARIVLVACLSAGLSKAEITPIVQELAARL